MYEVIFIFRDRSIDQEYRTRFISYDTFSGKRISARYDIGTILLEIKYFTFYTLFYVNLNKLQRCWKNTSQLMGIQVSV